MFKKIKMKKLSIVILGMLFLGCGAKEQDFSNEENAAALPVKDRPQEVKDEPKSLPEREAQDASDAAENQLEAAVIEEQNSPILLDEEGLPFESK